MTSQKDARLNVRLTKQEHATVLLRAKRAGLTASEYVRRTALQDTDRPIIHTDVDLLRDIYRNLRRAGSNLNQCARELNTHHKPNAIEDQLKRALAMVAVASEEVANFITEARESI